MSKPLVPLLLLVVLAAGGLAAWTLFDESRDLEAGAASAGPAAAGPADLEGPDQRPAPEFDLAGNDLQEAGRVADAGSRASVGEELGAGSPDQNFDLTDAQWVEGILVLSRATPLDERVVLWAVSTEDEVHALYGSEISIEDLTEYLSHQRDVELSVARVEVEASGRFRAPFRKGHQRGLIRLEARYAYLEDSPLIDLPSRPVTLEPQLGAWLTGQLVLPPALPDDLDPDWWQEVELSLNGWSMGAGPNNHSSEASLASDLRFEVGGLRPGLQYLLASESDSFVPVADMGLKAQPGERIERRIELQVGARISGRVLAPDGQPVAEAQVTSQAGGNWFGGFQRAEETDAQGRFTLRGLRPGKVVVNAGKAGFRDVESEKLELADGQVLADLTLTLDRGQRVTGKVVWPDGEPAVGAAVSVSDGGDDEQSFGRGRWRSGRSSSDATTDDEGNFTITGLQDGPYRLLAEARAEDERKWRTRLEGVQADQPVVLTLAPPIGAFGTVVDDRGRPVERFAVSFEEEVESGQDGSHGGPGFKDAGGKFELPDLSTGRWVLSATAPGHGPSREVTIELPGGEGPIELVTPRAAQVSGRVLDPFGAPVVGAEVTLSGSEESLRPWSTGEQIESGPDGSFTFEDVAPGPVVLEARSESWAPSEELTLQLEPATEQRELVISLRQGGRLTGEVFHEGAPDVGRSVMVQDLSNRGGMGGGGVTTDASGHFELDHLAPGTYQVIAFPEMDQLAGMADEEDFDPAEMMSRMKMASAEIVEGQTTHVVLGAAPQDPVHLTGRVTRQGEPMPGGIVMAVVEGGAMLNSMKMGRIDDEGNYELTLDQPGNYTFIVGQDMGVEDGVEFQETVPAEPEARLDFALPVGSISGRVVDASGRPLANIAVGYESDAGLSLMSMGGNRQGRSDADGRFQFENLRPGVYTVRAGNDRMDFFSDERPRYGVAVRSGVAVEVDRATTGVELVLSRPGTIVGTVLDGAGKPVHRAAIFVRTAAGQLLNPVSSTASDAAGRFRFEGASAGRYTVSARLGSQSSTESAAVSVVEGQESEVSVTLEPGTILRISVEDDDENPVRARIRVFDQEDRDVAGMMGSDVMETLFSEGISSTEQRVGPLPAGRYRVVASYGELTTTKMVTLRGQDDRKLRIRLKD